MPRFSLYHTWKSQLSQLRPDEHLSRLKTFSWLIVGIVLSKAVHLRFIANHMAGQSQQTSKQRRLRRWLNNPAVRVREWYEQVLEETLAEIVAHDQPIRLLLDGTVVGPSHQLLMLAVAYRRRALPLVWTWVRGRRGHSRTSQALALLSYLHERLPATATVIVCGDSEFGAVELLARLEAWGWYYAIRQRGNILLEHPTQVWQRLDALLPQPGSRLWLPLVRFTKTHRFRTTLCASWQAGHDQPCFLTTNLPTERVTWQHYSRRMWIEEMFGDLKGHGFDLAASRLRDFRRLSRLTLAAALAYMWLMATGSSVVKRGLRYLVDRTDRRDLSLFQIGWEMFQRRRSNQQPLLFRLIPYF